MGKNKEHFEQVGVVGVDSGTIMIGDPCYFLHKEPGNMPKDLGTSWQDFCERKLLAHNLLQLNYDKGHAGLAVVTSSGFGDGCYPVFARIEETEGFGRRVMAVLVDFSQHASGIKMKDGHLEKDTRKIFETIIGGSQSAVVSRNPTTKERCTNPEFYPATFEWMKEQKTGTKFMNRISYASDVYGNILGRCTCGSKVLFSIDGQPEGPLEMFKMWIVEHLGGACGKYEPKEESKIEAALKEVAFSMKKVTKEVG